MCQAPEMTSFTRPFLGAGLANISVFLKMKFLVPWTSAMSACGSVGHPISKLVVLTVLIDWQFLSSQRCKSYEASLTCMEVNETRFLSIRLLMFPEPLGTTKPGTSVTRVLAQNPTPPSRLSQCLTPPRTSLVVFLSRPQGTRTFLKLPEASQLLQLRALPPVLSLGLWGPHYPVLPQVSPSPSLARSLPCSLPTWSVGFPDLPSSPQISFLLSPGRPTPENQTPGDVLRAFSQPSYNGEGEACRSTCQLYNGI